MKIEIKQHDLKDCGAACIVSVAAYYNYKIQISRVRQYACTDRTGTSVLGLIRAAEKIGFIAKGVKTTQEYIKKTPLPAIAHIVRKDGDIEYHHYVVVYGIKKGRLLLMDPMSGKLEECNEADFFLVWTGVLILISPSNAFKEGDSTISLYTRFFMLIRTHKKVLLQALIGALIYTVLGLSTSFYLEKITDSVLINHNINLLNSLSVIMILIIVFQLLLSIFQSVIVLRTSQLIDSDLILDYYKHLLKLPQSFFDSMQIGEITSRIGDAVQIRNFVSSTAISLVVNVLIVIFSFALMFTYYWKLALVMVLIIPIYLFLYFISDKLNKKVERKVMQDSASLETQLVESLGSIRTIKQFGLEEYSNNKTESKFVRMLYSLYNSAKCGLFVTSTTEFINKVFLIILLWLGSFYVIKGEISAGELMSFYALIGYFTSPLTGLVQSNKSVRAAIIAFERLFEIMDLEREEKLNKINLRIDMVGDIVFKDVNFAYGTRKLIFEEFNLDIKKGSYVAIVGESGAGKSTLAHLLQNQYPLSSGKILIGGYDIKHIDNNSLRSIISIIPQQIVLFSGTILSNIAVGESEPEMKRIVEIVRMLGLTEMIEELPNGFYSYIGENGAQLSGGQRQRLALARALYKNPEILILDEATSSLDSISERYVQETIKYLNKQGKTIIVIAHKLSTIKFADKVCVISNGKLVEEGSFEELKSLDGTFNRLWTSQFLN